MITFANDSTYIIVESVAVKIPGIKQLDSSALILCPGVAVNQGSIQSEDANRECDEGDGNAPSGLRMFLQPKQGDAVEDEVEDLAHSHDSKV